MTSDISNYLKYATLQMAAESMYGLQTARPGQTFVGQIDPATLARGNGRASMFSASQSIEFSLDWTVVEHISKTTTGF